MGVIEKFDRYVIRWLKLHNTTIARGALFIVFFWFGALKVVMESPANPLVSHLLGKTLPFMTFQTFIVCFGVFEMIIGILFLIRGAERAAIACLLLHIITTFLPLVLLPSITWNGFMVPTLEGQYILKNFVIIALALSIAANLHPMKKI